MNYNKEEIREMVISKKELSEGCFWGYPKLEKIVCKSVITSISNRTLPEEHINTLIFRADEMPLFAFPQTLIIPACKGFAEAYCEGADIAPLVFKENVRFIKSHKRKLSEAALSYMPLLQILIKEKALTKNDTYKLLEVAQQQGNIEAAMLLINYTNDNPKKSKEADEFEL